jgi:hypothetical protein
MPVFKDAEQLYDVLGGLITRLKDDPVIGPAVLKSGLIIRFKYSEPESEITIDASKAPAEILFGPCDRTPVVDMSMKADTAHQFWLGKVNLVAALTRGTMVAKGPVPAIMKLLPVISPAYKLYPVILKEKGLEGIGG